MLLWPQVSGLRIGAQRKVSSLLARYKDGQKKQPHRVSSYCSVSDRQYRQILFDCFECVIEWTPDPSWQQKRPCEEAHTGKSMNRITRLQGIDRCLLRKDDEASDPTTEPHKQLFLD